MWNSSWSLVHLVPLLRCRSSEVVASSTRWWKSSRAARISSAIEAGVMLAPEAVVLAINSSAGRWNSASAEAPASRACAREPTSELVVTVGEQPGRKPFEYEPGQLPAGRETDVVVDGRD